MKRALWIGLILALGFQPLRAEAPAEAQRQLLEADQALERGLKRETEKRYAASRDAFQSAFDQLKALKKAAPEWEPDVVAFQMQVARDKLDWMMDKEDAAPAPFAPWRAEKWAAWVGAVGMICLLGLGWRVFSRRR
jgi:hypothetical protein